MNILIITSGYLPTPAVRGGAVENLIDFIIEDNEIYKNHEIILYSVYDKKIPEFNKYEKCQVNYINTESIRYKISRLFRGIINKIPGVYIGNAYICRVKKMIKKEDLDNIDFIIIENCPEFSLVIEKKLHKKLILHLHNDNLNNKTKLNKRIFNSYFKILTVSNFISNRVKKIDETSANKVNVLYNGIDLSKFNSELYDLKETRKKYNISKSDKVIMFSGRLVREKGIRELIEAFIKIERTHDLKLLIVGGLSYSNNDEDSYVKELRKLSREYSDRIIFTGFVNYEEIPKLYAIADIGVIPSLCNDAFNLTTIEFMQNEVPVIVSSNGAMKELITPDCGIVVEYDDKFIESLREAIIKLLDNRLRLQMGKNARIQANKFSKEIYCERFNKLLNIFEMENYNNEK
ncbi:glycosyltransferase family 4 protein [Romboutsia timonensis]|uniref:glycosyltransferase family 4 protein n=1 Tax=Romboutsia timonensis TaxID=1776391 RepID=UPI002A7F6C0C|nr:glycosyltransferase family 4 protein [Romboutsia timonensis]MDY3959688.1 glycosyltransferase family 4 protein [Romboutsia timonensis]